MKMRFLVVLTLVCISALVVIGQSQKKRAAPTPSPQEEMGGVENIAGVKWQTGPSSGALGSAAQVEVPDGYLFAGGNDTRLIMEALHNPTSGKEQGYLSPKGEDWFAVFEFDDVGYIKDDDKDSLDADAMLEAIKTGTEQGNKERLRRGWPTMTIVGWETQPRYDETTHNLEWAIRATSEGAPVVNYNTRLLGRGGVMEVTLVTDPASLATNLPKFKTMLAGFGFNQGQKYAEFRQGDKMAQYGLTGLIVGGTTAVLVKSGLFKWLWKGLVAIGIAISAFVRKLLGRRKAAQ